PALSTLSLHAALPICKPQSSVAGRPLDHHRIRSGKPSVSDEDVHPKFCVALDGVRVADPRPEFSHPSHGSAKVILDPGRDVHAEDRKSTRLNSSHVAI